MELHVLDETLALARLAAVFAPERIFHSRRG